MVDEGDYVFFVWYGDCVVVDVEVVYVCDGLSEVGWGECFVDLVEFECFVEVVVEVGFVVVWLC